MTPAARLVDDADRLGVRLEANGPKLRVVAPDDLPDHEWTGLRLGLAEHKAEVLAILAAADESVWSSDDCPAFADDPTLAVSLADLRESVEALARLHR
jgi:hypothetical protein